MRDKGSPTVDEIVEAMARGIYGEPVEAAERVMARRALAAALPLLGERFAGCVCDSCEDPEHWKSVAIAEDIERLAAAMAEEVTRG